MAKSGKLIWSSPEIMHFVAAGRQRVYAADKLGRLRVLDGRTGTVLDILATGGLPIKLCNDQTDRIYLATESGMVQCLHEVEETKPIEYNQSSKLQADEEQPAKAPKAKAQERERQLPNRRTKKPAAKKKDDGGFGDADQPAGRQASQAAPRQSAVQDQSQGRGRCRRGRQ